jgi:hypothetical protein
VALPSFISAKRPPARSRLNRPFTISKMNFSIEWFLRKHFCPAAKRRVLKLFEKSAEIQEVILLEEVGLLGGIRTTYLWVKFADRARFTIRIKNHRKEEEQQSVNRRLTIKQFADLFRILEHTKIQGLLDYNGHVIDGVFYVLCWGDRNNLNYLSIKNPQFGSPRHQQLINKIKASI